MRLNGQINDLTDDDRFNRKAEPPSIVGLLYRGRRHVVSGPPESLKTLVTLAASLEHIRAGGRVIYFDFENGPTAIRLALNDLGAAKEEISYLTHLEAKGAPDEEDVDDLLKTGVTLVVIDSSAGAYVASGLDDNSRMDVERFGADWIEPFWKAGVTTVLLDHVTKANETRGKFTIGSERKIGMADVHLGIEATQQLSRGKSGSLVVKTHKDRPGHLLRPIACEMELSSDPFTHRITYGFRAPQQSGDAWRPMVLMERVMDHFSRFPEALGDDDVVNAVYGNPEYIRKAIDVLIVDGKLGRDEYGRVQQI